MRRGFHARPYDVGRAVIRAATFSEDRRYRYVLRREWESIQANPRHFVVIGLNPSTADEEKDDPTIRRCIDFAQRERCGQLVMLNLFALVSTKPEVLYHDPERIGPENDEYIRRFTFDHECIAVAAWGVHGHQFPTRVERVASLVNVPLQCFGMTAKGDPRHPLYLAKKTGLVPFDARRTSSARTNPTTQ